MENPFFRNYYNATRPRYAPNSPFYSSPSVRSIPVRQVPPSNPSSSSKVVSIPVRFVGSETTRSAAAVKIQRFFRGFAVRKNVKKIAKIRAEADEIERRIFNSKDLIRSDAKERLQVNEMLMSLLFRLDSIRGFDPVVRDCRKASIRKVITLQEAVDAIVAVPDAEKNDQADKMAASADSSGNSETAAELIDKTLEIQDSAESLDNHNPMSEAAADQTPEMEGVLDSLGGCKVVDQTLLERQEEVELAEKCNNVSHHANDRTPRIQSSAELTEDCGNISSGVNQMAEVHDLVVGSVHNTSDGSDDIGVDKTVELPVPGESLETDEEPNGGERNREDGDLKLCASQCEEGIPSSKVVEKKEELVEEKEALEDHNARETQGSGGKSSDSSSSSNAAMQSMMERLMEENGELKDMVMELCERNALQNHLINSLSQRVELLERVAARSERMRQKKKKRRVETAAETKKCGRKM